MSAVAFTTYPSHRLADLVPPMSATDYKALAESIRTDGLEHAITLYEEAVLDGRHRLRACLEVGAQPRFAEYDGDDPVRFVMRQETRRHQTTSQRAMMAQAFLPELQQQARERQGAAGRVHGRGLDSSVRIRTELSSRAAEVAAEMVGVGSTTIYDAARIMREDPDLAVRVRDGELSVNAALKSLPSMQPTVTAGRTKSPGSAARMTTRQQNVANATRDRVEQTLHQLDGMCVGLAGIDPHNATTTSTEEQISQWLATADRARSNLRQFTALLRQMT